MQIGMQVVFLMINGLKKLCMLNVLLKPFSQWKKSFWRCLNSVAHQIYLESRLKKIVREKNIWWSDLIVTGTSNIWKIELSKTLQQYMIHAQLNIAFKFHCWRRENWTVILFDNNQIQFFGKTQNPISAQWQNPISS